MWLDRWAHEFRPRGATIEWITEIALDDPEIVEFFEPLRDPETGLVRDPETGRLCCRRPYSQDQYGRDRRARPLALLSHPSPGESRAVPLPAWVSEWERTDKNCQFAGVFFSSIRARNASRANRAPAPSRAS